MPHTLTLLVTMLTFLASTAGSGLAASWLFDRLRTEFPAERAAGASPLTRRALALLHAPAYARISAMALAALISLAATAAICLLSDQPMGETLDAVLAPALAALIGQIWHGLSLDTALPEDA